MTKPYSHILVALLKGIVYSHNEKVLALGKKLRVNATPTTVFMDGSRLTGAVDVKALEGKLMAIK